MAKKAKGGVSKKEKTDRLIQRWAFGILFALVIELLVYVIVLNLVPTLVKTKIETEEQKQEVAANPQLVIDGEYAALLNPFYKTDRCYTTQEGSFTNEVDNPTWLIYYYNTILLVASILLMIYYLVTVLEQEKKIAPFLKKEWPFTLLLIFITWVFLSSCFARDSYRSFVGCYNLKDGFLSFLMYGSMLVCSLFIVKDNEKYKKILVNTFLITATILAAITLWNYSYLISDQYDTTAYRYQKYGTSWYARYFITYGKETDDGASMKAVYTLGEWLFGNGGLKRGNQFMIVTKRVLGENHSGVFHNSNHYGYYLSISVVAAMVMCLKEKEIWKKILYFISYIIMLKMAIINNTLGAYLGIGASIFFMLIYVFIPKAKMMNASGDQSESSLNMMEIGMAFMILFAFVFFSATLNNDKGENIVYTNFSGIASDLSLLIHHGDSQSQTENGATEEATLDSLEEETIAKSDTNVVVSQSASYNSLIIYYLIGSIAFVFLLIPHTYLGKGQDEEKAKKTRQIILLACCLVWFSCFMIAGVKAKKIASDDLEIKKKTIVVQNNNKDNQVSEIGSGRGKLWYRGMHLAMQRPFFGWGLENIIYEYSNQFDIGEGRSHNLIVQLSATVGIVGMLLYVTAMAGIWIRKLKYIKTWDLYECLGMFVMVSYLISSFVGNSGFYSSPYFYLFVGFVILSSRNKIEK